MERRAFLRLLGLGLALGPEAIAEAMKPQIFYSIPAGLGASAVTADELAAYDAVLRYVYEHEVRELIALPSPFAALMERRFIGAVRNRQALVSFGA